MEKIIHHIRRVRRQPEHIKRHILHVAILICGIVLAMLWIYSLGTTLANQDTQSKIGNDLKPFSAIKDDMIGGYNSITEPNLGTQPTAQ